MAARAYALDGHPPSVALEQLNAVAHGLGPHAMATMLFVVIDLDSGDIHHWARLEGVVSELYDVVILPGVVRPMALGFKTDEIQRTIAISEDGLLS